MMRRSTLFLATVALLPGSGPAQGQSQTARLPPRIESYVDKYVKLDAAARAQLMSGAPVTKLLDADPSKELVVFGGVWVNAPIDHYVRSVRDIERFESGQGFLVTKKIGTPPTLDDFAKLTVPDDDFKDMQSCKVDDCELKMSKEGIEKMHRDVNWNSPDAHEQVNRIVREQALGYVTGYLEGGNERLAVYRDASRPTFVAKEFASMIDSLPTFGELLPELRRYLLDFPKATLPGSESYLYWQEAAFGLKPTIRINHVVITQEPGGALFASKMLYASHYFWTGLELRALVRDPSRGDGFWFITESRTRSDGLSGFVGRIIRGRVRDETTKGTETVLRLTKEMLES